MSDRKLHFAGTPVALAGYSYGPCGALLDHRHDPLDIDHVTCKWCLQWASRYHNAQEPEGSE